jgi:hypothetical protein
MLMILLKCFWETSDSINNCTVDLHVYKVSCMQINLASVYVCMYVCMYVSVDLYSD